MKTATARTMVLAWDWPARVCHWGFALSLSTSLIIAFRSHPESDLFKYHVVVGLLAAWFLSIRIALGFFGSAQSRWRAFYHPPRRIARYLASVVLGRTDEHKGLNPGTALFAPAVYVASFALIVTGFDADWVETWHGWLAWGAVGLIGAHLLGLTLHACRHRELTPLTMVHGKQVAASVVAPARSNVGWGVAVLTLSCLLAGLAVAYFDPRLSQFDVPLLPKIELPMIQKG